MRWLQRCQDWVAFEKLNEVLRFVLAIDWAVATRYSGGPLLRGIGSQRVGSMVEKFRLLSLVVAAICGVSRRVR